MATYEVSTWNELITELSTLRTEAVIIKLTADIDCNDEIPLGVASTITIWNSAAYPMTVTGAYVENGVTKNRVIRNLRTHVVNPVNIFYPKSNIDSGQQQGSLTFTNIDFINLVLDRANLSVGPDSGVIYNNQLAFNRCRFVGRRNCYLIAAYSPGGENGNALTFTSCFFNMPFIPKTTESTYTMLCGNWTHGSAYLSYANFCWFRESYNNWDQVATDSKSSCYNIKLNGCYLDGTIKSQIYKDVRSSFYDLYNQIRINQFTSYIPAIQNVVDCTLLANPIVTQHPPRYDYIDIYAPQGLLKNYIFRIGSSTQESYNSVTPTTEIVATPAQMKDPQWLYNNGFDIVVPTT